MSSKKLTIALAFLLVIGWTATAKPEVSVTEPFRPEADKRAIIEEIDKAAAQSNTINRLLVEYESIGRKNSIHHIVAATVFGDLYFFASHFEAHPWQTDVTSQELFVHEGKSCSRRTFNRAYAEYPMDTEQPLSGSIPEDVLLAVLPRWPLTMYKLPVGPFGTRVIAAEAVQSVDYRLLSETETIGGESCMVFDCKGGDRIWIATRKGYCVMRRETRTPSSGLVTMRVITDRVTQITPNLWLPTECRQQYFTENHGTNRFITEVKVKVLRFLLNDDVPASTFMPVHRPGTIKMGERGQITQITAGGEDLLDEIVHMMTNDIHLPSRPIQAHRSYRWLLIGLAGGLGAGFLVLPTGKRRAGKDSVPKDTPSRETPTTV